MRRLVSDLCFVAALIFGVVYAAQAQFNSFPPGVFTGRAALDAASGGFTPNCTASSNFLARTSGLSNTNKTNYDNFICGAVTDGWWASMDAVYLYAAPNSTTALLNLVQATCNMTATGSPTFTAFTGFAGNGTTQFLDSGCNLSTLGGHYAQDSATHFYKAAVAGTTDASAGAYTGANPSAILLPTSATACLMRMNQTASSVTAPTGCSDVGFLMGSRMTATTTSIASNGTELFNGTGGGSSTGIPNSDFFALGSASNNLIATTIEVAGFGANIQPSIANVYSRWSTYKTAVGAP